MVIVEKITVGNIERSDNFKVMLEEYGRESGISGLPEPLARMETYRALEKSGMMTCFGVFYEDTLVGFATVLVSDMPHYSQPVATTESFFVMAEHRGTGAGMSLLREVEAYAASRGAAGILVSSPSQGALVDILPRKGYSESNRVFFKGLNDAG